MESNFRVTLLLGASVGLILLSRIYVPVISLIAFCPLIWLLEGSSKQRIPVAYWFLGSSVILTISALFYLDEKFLAPIYGVGLTMALSVYLLTSKFSKNRLGIFTILLFWLGFDYLVLKVLPTASSAFLSSFFDGAQAMGWSRTTGNLGITAWIVISNILCYYVFLWQDAIFKKTIRWMSLIYAIIFISIPILISSYFVTYLAPVTLLEMKSVYMNSHIIADIRYSENGEWLGRTCAWVSILVVVYALIKRKTK
ncbi:MAG: hypothetical protein AAGF85_21835 [Bacteroidota bacterium]